MKIIQLSWANFKGLVDGSIVADGGNVTVSGRNGAGKSSIASVLPFILFGKDAKNVKRFDNGLIPTVDGLIHAAEVTFDDGNTLRREYLWTSNANRNVLYINGKQVSQTAFKTHVANITGCGGDILFDPFAFHALKPDDQRNILVSKFAPDINSDSLNAEFADLVECLDGRPVDTFITQTNAKLNSLKTESRAIPSAIEENRRQIDSTDIDAELRSVDAKIADLHSKRDNLAKRHDFNLQLSLAQKRLGELDRQQDRCEQHLRDLQSQLQTLRNDYSSAAKEICPYCRQPFPKELRDAKLSDIVQRGNRCKSDIAQRQDTLSEIANERRDLLNQIDILQADARANSDIDDKINALNSDIQQLSERKFQLQNQARLRERINVLSDKQAEINKQIADLEHLLRDAKNFLRRKIELVEDAINSHFALVKFKLFDYRISTGEAVPTCEVTLHGVPYVALSKGERLRAALDTFKTLQDAFGVELPIMLDDAESYTPNSLVELNNQIFAFKVADTDLNIIVDSV